MKNFSIIALIFLCMGCAMGIDGALYEKVSPELKIEDFFNQDVKAWGIVQDRSGNLIKSFEVDIKCSWKGNLGTLDESFKYSDGKTQRRIWKITKLENGTYQGKADDIVDTATGTSYGNALRWNYEMDLDVDGSTYRIEFDDWMWLLNKNVLANRSYMKKFGITVGEISIFMQKQ